MEESQRSGRGQATEKRSFIIHIKALRVYIVTCGWNHRDATESLGSFVPGSCTVMIAPECIAWHEHYPDGRCKLSFYYDNSVVSMQLQALWRMQTDAGVAPATI